MPPLAYSSSAVPRTSILPVSVDGATPAVTSRVACAPGRPSTQDAPRAVEPLGREGRRGTRADAAAVVATDLDPAAAGQRALYRERAAADTEGLVVDPEVVGVEEVARYRHVGPYEAILPGRTSPSW